MTREVDVTWSAGYCQQRVDAIRAQIRDNEIAHSEEDALYHDFVRAVAELCPEPSWAEMARSVLLTEKLDFTRWYA